MIFASTEITILTQALIVKTKCKTKTSSHTQQITSTIQHFLKLTTAFAKLWSKQNNNYVQADKPHTTDI